MATFGDLKFNSEESDDEDYIDSGSSSDENNEHKGPSESEDRLKDIQEKLRQKRLSNVFKGMLQDAMNDTRHESTILPTDGLLQYHLPNPKVGKMNTTISELFNYLRTATGASSPLISGASNIREYKHNLRLKESGSRPSHLSASVAELRNHDAEVKVTKLIKFAGQTYSVQESMNRHSRKYKNYLKEQSGANKLGGTFGGLDTAIDQLKTLQGVSSIEKSRSDWESFKNIHQLNVELEGTEKDGFLSRQAFLANVDNAQHEINLEAKKKRRLLSGLNMPTKK